MRHMLCVIVCLAFLVTIAHAQDTGTYRAYPNQFWSHIEEKIAEFEQKPAPSQKQFRLNLDGKEFPTQLELYQTQWHNPSISQGNSGTCWDYCTTSFYESEIYRVSGKKVDLSEMYTMYWETVEKARRFVKERGNSAFEEGSQSSAVRRIWKQYGIVPADAYTGMKQGQTFVNHSTMFEEMKAFLQSVKANNCWNETFVLETIQAILNHHMGCPPTQIMLDGQSITPKEYLATLGLNLDEYMELISLAANPKDDNPYYKNMEYCVRDNWWHSEEYFNIPLDDFIGTLRYAMANGFTLVLGGDVSEPGYDSGKKVAIIPSFDIPSSAIDEHARLFRFANGTTGDDHGIHCVGTAQVSGQNWYLIKDSGSGSRNVEPKGYYFYHEDYIKLKMMNILVHKDACPKIWEKYQAQK